MKATILEIGREDDRIKFNAQTHEIDYSKTKDNYSVLPVPGIRTADEMYQRYEERMSQLKCMKREDVKVLGQWVWTAPSDLPKEHRKACFEAITEFFANKHGLENMVYAQVHVDETNEHLHIGIIPAVPIDKPKEGGPTEKVCAKEVFTKEYLSTAHADCQAYVSEKLGFEVNLINGASLGVDGIVAYKKMKDLAKAIGAMEETLEAKKQEIALYDTAINTLKEESAELHREIEFELKPKKKKLEDKITELSKWLTETKDKIKDAIEFMLGSPNLLTQFYRWATNWKATDKQAEDKVNDYVTENQIELNYLNSIVVPDTAAEDPAPEHEIGLW